MELSTLQIELFQSIGGLLITLALGAVIVFALSTVVKLVPTKWINKIF